MSIAQAPARTIADVAWEGVFPLPLTPMEGFLLTDSRPGYPMMCDIQLEFEGTLDRDVFSSALAAALVRNPLFCSIVARDPRVGWAWMPTDQTPTIDWAAEGTPLGDRYDATIDLSQEIGLRSLGPPRGESRDGAVALSSRLRRRSGTFQFRGRFAGPLFVALPRRPGGGPASPRTAPAA